MYGPIVHHAHRPIGNADIVGVIVDICIKEKAYRTILLIASMSKHHHAIVQPVLTRIKDRVVLDLDDFAWRDRENDGNIDINSIIPVELGSKHVDPELETRLHPAILLCRGRPGPEAFKLWDGTFPRTAIMVFSEDARTRLNDATENFDSPIALSTKALKRFHQLYNDALMKEEVPYMGTVRYALHTAYQQLRLDCPGQRVYQLRNTDRDGHLYEELDVSLCDLPFRQEDIADECVSMCNLPWVSYVDLSLTCYIQLSENSAGALFLREDDIEGTVPPAYQTLSEMIERLTTKTLRGQNARFIFRLFILQHGERMIDREAMTPIYSSITRLAPADPKRPLVIKRDYDEDFAGCIVNDGCRRCRD